jgi:large subunit ribosomal protein L4
VAKIVKIKDMPELGLEEPNMLHIQESYTRQVAHSKPITAKKKRKSDVTATGAKWFRQKGTGRARQGERTNPHMYGGGLAFPPHPRLQNKKLNKRVRISALRSAVLAHVLGGSAYCVQGPDFEDAAKTREVYSGLDSVFAEGSVVLVLPAGAGAWLAGRNIAGLTMVHPEEINVRDLVDNDSLVFTTGSLQRFKELLEARNAAPEEAEPAPQAKPEPAQDAAEDAEDTGESEE